MSKLDDAMQEHMAYLVLSIGRPFSFKDFLRFEVDGIEHKPTYGTVRNKFLAFKKKGIIEPDYNSGLAFYTLKGSKFGKPMTPYPYGGLSLQIKKSDPLYRTLQNLPFGAESIHDIRLRFIAPNIYKTFSCLLFPPNNFYCNTTSGDIAIPSFYKEGAIVRIVIHRTDVVSVIIGCSNQPIPLYAMGLIRFSSLLTRAEDKLQSILDNYYHNQKQYYNYTAGIPAPAPALVVPVTADMPTTAAAAASVVIPQYQSWIITMWHFGRDALTEYNGDKFTRTIEDAQHVLTRIYSKEYGSGKGRRKRTRIRAETQEYPNKTVEDAIDELESQDEEQEAS